MGERDMNRTGYDRTADLARGILLIAALSVALFELPTITQWVLTITGATP